MTVKPARKRCEGRSRASGLGCQCWAIKGKRWCRFHGGKGKRGSKTPEGIARNRAAAKIGQEKATARMWLLKDAGLIDRFPRGRKKGAAWITAKQREAIGLAPLPSQQERPAHQDPWWIPPLDEPLSDEHRALALHAIRILRDLAKS